MSDIRYNGWLHRSGTGGVWQDSSGNVGIGSSVPSNAAVSANTKVLNVGVITATTYYGSGANLTGITGTTINNNADNKVITGSGTANTLEAEASLTFDAGLLKIDDLSGTAGKGRLEFGNSGEQYIEGYDTGNAGSGSYLTIGSNADERIRIDSSGRFLVGATAKRNVLNQNANSAGDAPTPLLYAEGTGDSKSLTLVSNNTNAWRGSVLGLARTRGTSVGDSTIIQDDDNIGQIVFAAGDGTDIESNAATIRADVDGTPGANDTPGRLVFSTTADGAVIATERLRITSDGKVGLNEDTPVGDLHITTAGSSQQDGVLYVGGSDGTMGLVLDYDQSGSTIAKITANPTYTNTSAQLKICVDGDANADQLVLTGAGNAGINTGSSNFPLKIDCNGASATDAVALHLNNTAGAGRGRAGIVFGSRGGTGAYAAKMFGGPNNDDAGHGDLVFTCANNSGTQNTMLFLHGKSYSDGKIQATPGGGGFQILGALSKSSGSFRIPHPLAGLSTTKDLVHSFIEGPQADLIYRGVSTLSSGTSTVNIDTEARMTDGTFVALADNVSCFTSNETDWKAVKGSVSGNILTISCEDNTSTAKVSWLVVGERCDAHMISTETAWTDDNGRVITEVDQEPPLS